MEHTTTIEDDDDLSIANHSIAESTSSSVFVESRRQHSRSIFENETRERHGDDDDDDMTKNHASSRYASLPMNDVQEHDESKNNESMDTSFFANSIATSDDSVLAEEWKEHEAQQQAWERDEQLDLEEAIRRSILVSDNSSEITATSTDGRARTVLDEEDDNILKEVYHLQRRIRNLQESINLSNATGSLTIPRNWKHNCLNAIQNCIVEWRSIVSHHNDLNQIKQQENEEHLLNISGQEEEGEQQHLNKIALKRVNSCGVDSDLLAVEWSKTTSVQLFQLVQMAMQVGPLSGSKPGYFKRCGSDVAQLAFDFLITLMNGSSSNNSIDMNDERISNNEEAVSVSRQSKTSEWSISPTQIKYELRLTEKQIQVIQKWIMNAEKAVMGKNSPSKSVRKKQKQNEAKLQQKREIRQKKFDKKKK